MARIDLLVYGFKAEIIGARLYLEDMAKTLPELKAKAFAKLEEDAKTGGWDWEDSTSERDLLDDAFDNQLRLIFTYSFLTHLYSIAEVQLGKVAARLRTEKKIPVSESELSGKGIQRTKKYLSSFGSVNFSQLAKWESLTELQKIRNLIVHNSGYVYEGDPNEIKSFQRISGKYKGELIIPSDLGKKGMRQIFPIQTSLRLCEILLASVEEFFLSLYNQLGYHP